MPVTNQRPIPPQRFRPFVQRRERGIQHFTRFQARQGRCVHAHAFGYLGQGQSLGFALRFESGRRPQGRHETPLIDGTGRSLTDQVRCVLAADGLFLG